MHLPIFAGALLGVIFASNQPTIAGYLCDQLSMRGESSLAASCMLDEMEQERQAVDRKQRQQFEDLQRQRQEQTRESMDYLDRLLREDRTYRPR